jgi:hypothetical protein
VTIHCSDFVLALALGSITAVGIEVFTAFGSLLQVVAEEGVTNDAELGKSTRGLGDERSRRLHSRSSFGFSRRACDVFSAACSISVISGN